MTGASALAELVYDLERQYTLGTIDSVAEELGWTEAEYRAYRADGTVPLRKKNVVEEVRREAEDGSKIPDADQDDGTIIDLGGPEGGRYWRVESGHAVDDPDALNAAVHARVTGSVGATYNDAKVARWPAEPPAVPADQLNPFLAGITHADSKPLELTAEQKEMVEDLVADVSVTVTNDSHTPSPQPKTKLRKRPVASRAEVEAGPAYAKLTTETAYWLHYSRWAAVKQEGRWRVWSTHYEVLAAEPNDFGPEKYDQAVVRATTLNDAESELGLEIHRARQQRDKEVKA